MIVVYVQPQWHLVYIFQGRRLLFLLLFFFFLSCLQVVSGPTTASRLSSWPIIYWNIERKWLANSWERRRKAPEKGAVYLDKCILGVTEAVHTRQSCRPSTMENKVYCFMWHSILKSWRLYTKAEPFTPKRNHLHQSWENNVPFIFLIKRQSRSQLL